MAPRGKNSKSRISGREQASESGATGGASTNRGLIYQFDYGVFKTLDLICHALSAPHKRWAIRIEPRAASKGSLTRWDLGTEPPEKYFEAKLNPKRDEILEWLDHVRSAGTDWPERQFRLVYSEGGGPLLTSLKSLLRISSESRNDTHFYDLIAEECLKDSAEILDHLGKEAYSLLLRTRLKNVPEDLLKGDAERWARMLAGEQGGRRLSEMLFVKLQNAGPHRTTILIGDIIRDVKAAGVTLQPPPDVDPQDLPNFAVSALHILQSCRSGLPMPVLASAVGAGESSIREELTPLFGSILHLDGDIASIGPLPSRITPRGGAELKSRALDSLLEFLEQRKNDELV
jgi:hypothetical protein